MARKQYAGITEQRKASLHRLADAEALFQKERWRGAMYLAGYAVECRLKYQLMRKWKCFTLEELEATLARKGVGLNPFTHNLDSLLKSLGCRERLRLDQPKWTAFTKVNRWRPAWRYSAHLASRDAASIFLSAVRDVIRWVENNC